jgi:hypothetical protein
VQTTEAAVIRYSVRTYIHSTVSDKLGSTPTLRVSNTCIFSLESGVYFTTLALKVTVSASLLLPNVSMSLVFVSCNQSGGVASLSNHFHIWQLAYSKFFFFLKGGGGRGYFRFLELCS